MPDLKRYHSKLYLFKVGRTRVGRGREGRGKDRVKVKGGVGARIGLR